MRLLYRISRACSGPVDGGKSWSSLNSGLQNLPSMRLMSLPTGGQGAQLALSTNQVVEWAPGEKLGMADFR